MTLAQLDLFGGETAAPAPVPDGPRYAYACARCAEWFFAAGDEGDSWGGLDCPICNGRVTLRGRVDQGRAVADYLVPACDDRCTGARGTVCECQCGGRNHGSGRMVIVTHDLGGRPRLDLANASKLATLSAKRLPEIERAETLAAELVEVLDHRHRAELYGYRNSQWLDAGEYARLREWQGYRDAIRKAERLKVPANRVRRLEELRQKIGATS